MSLFTVYAERVRAYMRTYTQRHVTQGVGILILSAVILWGGIWDHNSWWMLSNADGGWTFGAAIATIIQTPWWLCGGSTPTIAILLCIAYAMHRRGYTMCWWSACALVVCAAGLSSYCAVHAYHAWLPGGVIGLYVHGFLARVLPGAVLMPALLAGLLAAALYTIPFAWTVAAARAVASACALTGIPLMIRYSVRVVRWWGRHCITRFRRWLPYQPSHVFERTQIEKLIDQAYHEQALPDTPAYMRTEHYTEREMTTRTDSTLHRHVEESQKYAEEISQPGTSTNIADSDYEDNVHARPSTYDYPHLDLLSASEKKGASDAGPAHAAQHIEEKLARFGIQGRIVAVTRGPSVTLYEYEPHGDVKLSRILAFEDDIALAVQALSVRILAPIPGSSVVGFEVARSDRDPVLFGDVMQHARDRIRSCAVPVVVGLGSRGAPYICDMTQAPHLLIAGSTGSGKSVALHTVIVSTLFHTSPEDVRMVLIDPKRLEFTRYADIPHLAFPVITDARAALDYLQWAVTCMEERYELLAQAHVRSIAEYHAQHGVSSMPYIMIVIDELADLMMTAGKEVELSLARLAQMARAAGIHLVVATQRPSVDVITGLIKVNIPTRIACRVASKIDSRTILDDSGAEKLLGKGDMLILDAKGLVERVQGAYISEVEIDAVVAHVKRSAQPDYWTLPRKTHATSGTLAPEDQGLYRDIIGYLRTVDLVSISQLQRQFDIGYNRSARMIDVLTQQGVVVSVEKSKMRKVVRDHEIFMLEQE